MFFNFTSLKKENSFLFSFNTFYITKDNIFVVSIRFEFSNKCKFLYCNLLYWLIFYSWEIVLKFFLHLVFTCTPLLTLHHKYINTTDSWEILFTRISSCFSKSDLSALKFLFKYSYLYDAMAVFEWIRLLLFHLSSNIQVFL